MNQVTNVLLVDDHHIVRNGIHKSLAENPEIEVAGEANNAEEVLAMLPNLEVSVVITDISMPGMTGIDLSRKLLDLHPHVRVLFLTMHSDPIYVIKAFEAGASGYLLKDVIDDELQKAIVEIGKKRKYINSFVSEILASHVSGDLGGSKKYELTTREAEVLNSIVAGLTNKQIAHELSVSDRTIDTHRSNIMQKIGARNTADIVRIAIAENLVSIQKQI